MSFGSEQLEKVSTIYGPTYAFKGDMITNQLKRFGAHTRPELAMLLSFIQPGDLVFDIGAHIGTFAIPIAKKVGPSGRVLAVEGYPPTAEVLRANVALAEANETVIVECAMLGGAGEAYEPVFNTTNTGATYFRAASIPASGAQVSLAADSLVERYFAPTVVKLDIEGFEFSVLSRSSRLLSAKPVLYIEISTGQAAREPTPIGALDDFLGSQGYRMYRNIGPRNAPNDDFSIAEMRSLAEGGGFFDVVCIHSGDSGRIPPAVSGEPAFSDS